MQPVSGPAARCGENKVAQDLGLPVTRLGCGEPIDACANVYRCTDCRTPFHHHCALKHFGKDHVAAPLLPRRSDAERAEEVFREWATGSEPVLAALERALRLARVQGAHEAFEAAAAHARASADFARRASDSFAGGDAAMTQRSASYATEGLCLDRVAGEIEDLEKKYGRTA